MLVYRVYSFDMTNGYELIGILPERRGDLMRITRESVIKWGRMLSSEINQQQKYLMLTFCGRTLPIRQETLRDF